MIPKLIWIIKFFERNPILYESSINKQQQHIPFCLIFYNYMKMNIKIFCLTAFIILEILSERIVNFTSLNLSPYNVDNKWGQIQQILKGPPITALIFKGILLCDQGIKRVLNYNNIDDSFHTLFIQSSLVGSKTLKVIWQTKAIRSVKNLTLSNCNFDNDDLDFFPLQQNLNLEALNFEMSFISGAGMEKLSKLNITKLKNLNLFGISLVDDIAVDSLLKMSLDLLTDLNIGSTGISSKNILKIFKKINTRNMRSLNLTYNNFDVEFYQELGKLEFHSLESLDLSKLLIDETATQYLEKMKFPQLKKLSIGGNQLFINGYYSFLNRQNYPKLERIQISNTIFENSFFSFFVKQFKNTKFKQIVLEGNGIEAEMLQHISRLDMQDLQIFYVADGFLNPEVTNTLVRRLNRKSLVEFTLRCKNTGDILSIFLEGMWPNLRILDLQKVKKINGQKLDKKEWNQTFPQLEKIRLNAANLRFDQVRQLVLLLAKSSDKQLRVDLIANKPELVMQQIVNNKYQNISRSLYLSLSFIQEDQEKKQDQSFDLFLRRGQKPLAIRINFYKLLNKNYFYHSEILEEQEIQQLEKKELQDPNLITYFQDNSHRYLQAFDFSSLLILEEQFGLCTVIEYIESQSNSGSTLEKLKAYFNKNLTDQCLEVFGRLNMPNLKFLSIQFTKRLTSNTKSFSLLPLNISQLGELYFINEAEIPNQKVLDMFKRQQFSSLDSLTIAETDMGSQEIKLLLDVSPNKKKIRKFQLYNTRANDLQFIAEENLVLRKIYLIAQILGQSLSKINKINFQFVSEIAFVATGLTNQNFIEFVEGVRKKHKPAFPKVINFRLNFNTIEDEGLRLLFQSGIPMLQFFQMIANSDPNIINTILNSTDSHRIQSLDIFMNDEDSIDPNMNPKNTRSLKHLIIQTGKLRNTDFKALSKLDFRALNEAVIYFTKYFECQSLIYLLKILTNVKSINLLFSKQVGGFINSDCIVQILKSDQNLRHLQQIEIINQDPIYSNLQRLFDTIIFDQQISKLALVGVYPSQKSFRRMIVQAKLQYITQIILDSNDLTDNMVLQLLQQQFTQLQVLSLSQNPKLTKDCLQAMVNKTYYSLQTISLSGTKIDDIGLVILKSCSFPSLIELDLSMTQITCAALNILSEINAPFLNSIDLSFNNLKAIDFIGFDVNKLKSLRKIVLNPVMKQKQYRQLDGIINKGRSKQRKIKIETQKEYEVNFQQIY